MNINESNTPIIGTYHKTGTVLIQQIFEEYLKKDKTKIIIEENFGKITPKDILNKKSLAVIRHPYEIVVSGLNYHLRGTEEWLHIRCDLCDGLIYSEEIRRIETLEEKINFETKTISKKIINSIYYDIINKKNCLFIKLENFWSVKSRTKVSKKICHHMNLNLDILQPIILKKAAQKYNFTNRNFSHMWPIILNKNNIEFIDSLIPKDAFEVFGYSKIPFKINL